MGTVSTLAYRYLGIFECSLDSLRSRWLEVSWRGRPGAALELCRFSDDDELGHFSLHVHLLWPNIFLRLPLPRSAPVGQVMDSWGLQLCRDSYSSVHLNWGDRCRIVRLPWDWTWERTSYLCEDGGWTTETRDDPVSWWERYELVRQIRDEHEWRRTYPYTYVLRSGEVQRREATVSVRETEMRWRGLRHWGPGRTRRSIDVVFSGEVGERTGSWKGGCTGCGWDLREGETPETALRRMERTRKF